MGFVLNFDFQFESQVDPYLAALDDAVEIATHNTAQTGAELAAEMAPVDTSSLQSTIDATPDDGLQAMAGGSLHAHAWSINAGNIEGGYLGGGSYGDKPAGSPVDYAAAQEYGLGPGGFTPFMTPTAEALVPIFDENVTVAIQSVSGG